MKSNDRPDGIVASNIRAELGRQRVTVKELSRRTGISRSTLQGHINGASAVTVNVLFAVAAALEVEPVNLLPEPRPHTEAAA